MAYTAVLTWTAILGQVALGLALHVTPTGIQPENVSRYSLNETTRKPDAMPLYMTFKVCNGATNQRIALIQGLAIGSLLNADIVLPDVQTSYNTTFSQNMRFSEVFQVGRLAADLQGVLRIMGVSGTPLAVDFGKAKTFNVYNKPKTVSSWARFARQVRGERTSVIQFGCTFNSLSALGDQGAIELLWRIDRAIRLATPLQQIADKIVGNIRAMSPTGRFTVLHLRIEHDWVAFCKTYHAKGNCMANEAVLHSVLAIERVPTSDPIYVAAGMSIAKLYEDTRFHQMMRMYHIMMKEDAYPNIYQQFSLTSHRDVLALVDFAVALEADQFIGNCVSTWSAMIELRRKILNPRLPTTFHYNGGPIPLSYYMPINPKRKYDGDFQQYETAKPIKWVFTMIAGASQLAIHHMKVAVMSAIANTTLVPYCLYYPVDWTSSHPPQETSDAEQWLLDKGVVVIRHRPSWVWKVQPTLSSGALQTMIAKFMRFDIPVVGFTDNYILYTDIDIMFMRDLRWEDLGKQLPELFLMGSDIKVAGDARDGNAGVMLLQIDHLRRLYNSFIDWVFKAEDIKKGFEGGHVVDLYQRYYSGNITLVDKPLFNWRPFWETTEEEFDQVIILHLEAPNVTKDSDSYMSSGSVNTYSSGVLKSCSAQSATCKAWLERWDSVTNCISDTSLPCASPGRINELRATARITSTNATDAIMPMNESDMQAIKNQSPAGRGKENSPPILK